MNFSLNVPLILFKEYTRLISNKSREEAKFIYSLSLLNQKDVNIRNKLIRMTEDAEYNYFSNVLLPLFEKHKSQQLLTEIAQLNEEIEQEKSIISTAMYSLLKRLQFLASVVPYKDVIIADDNFHSVCKTIQDDTLAIASRKQLPMSVIFAYFEKMNNIFTLARNFYTHTILDKNFYIAPDFPIFISPLQSMPSNLVKIDEKIIKDSMFFEYFNQYKCDSFLVFYLLFIQQTKKHDGPLWWNTLVEKFTSVVVEQKYYSSFFLLYYKISTYCQMKHPRKGPNFIIPSADANFSTSLFDCLFRQTEKYGPTEFQIYYLLNYHLILQLVSE